MKVAYKHLINFIPSKPSIDEVSDKLFQLGHEHEIVNNIFHMDLTPNRGDCLSVHGLVKDLAPFYEIDLTDNIYMENLEQLDLDFINKAPEACANISFLKIDIEGEPIPYNGELKEYFEDLDNNKNNFFTDVSNYLSYERGQPTHCYDAKKIEGSFSLEFINEENKFKTLQDKEILLTDKNLVFLQDNKVINLAGVMGGKDTSCSIDTKSVIIECAHFEPEYIIGKSIKYNIQSEAAHKFERGVDPLSHENVLRRFIRIVSNHVKIKNVKILKSIEKNYVPISIPYSLTKVAEILGISIKDEKTLERNLSKLGFNIIDNIIIAPSYRNDIKTINDVAEEVARTIGYNNIPAVPFKVPATYKNTDIKTIEQNIKSFLIKNGFYEVINNPFINVKENFSLRIDNPLDSNREFIRTNLKTSLLENLIYNQRRQQDSIKLFEISDIYYFENGIQRKKVLGLICSGRVGKNYQDFSKRINIKYIQNLMKELSTNININPTLIDSKNLNTKQNNEIVYLELELNSLRDLSSNLLNNKNYVSRKYNFVKYSPISEFPSSTRDLSFSIKDVNKYYEIQEFLLEYKSDLIKEIFIFDFYNNQKANEIKLGFRFVFQSKTSTITEEEVNEEMDIIIKQTLSMNSVSIPGLPK